MEKLQTIIFLVRHGATSSVYSSDPNLDDQRVLTEQGREQSQKVGEYLENFAPAAIYASPRRRTIETADIIRESAKIPSEVKQTNRLYEYYPPEKVATLEQRVTDFIEQLAKSHAGEQIVAVSHQDVIEGAVRALGFQVEEADFPCRVAQVYRLVLAGDRVVECLKLNPART